MNHKKYIAVGGIFLLIGAVTGAVHYFYPGVIENVFSSGSGDGGADVLSSDIDMNAPNDTIISSSTASDDDDGTISAPPVSSASKKVVKKNSVSIAAQNNLDNNVSDSQSEPSEIISAPPASPSLPAPVPVPACSFPDGVSLSASRQIIFNEIAWMGSASSSNAEWMEIKNISAASIDLSGWEIINASGKIGITFSSGDAIPASGLFLLSRNASSSGKTYTGNLVNTGDRLAILDAQCDASDILDASDGWPAGNNTTKQTMERDADNLGWHTSVVDGGTPGTENSAVVTPIPKISSSTTVANNISPVAPTITVEASPADISTSTIDSASSSPPVDISAASGHILIETVQISGASSANDLVKLYNPTAGPVDMSGWKLHKRSSSGTEYSLKVLPTGSVIGAGQSFVWANSTDGFSETVAANVSSTETLSADNSVALLDENGTVIDAVAWGSGTNQFGEGSPYPTDPASGQVLTRQISNGTIVDTSNNANDFILQ